MLEFDLENCREIIERINGHLCSGESLKVPGTYVYTVQEYAIKNPSGYISRYHKDDITLTLAHHKRHPVTRQIKVTVEIADYEDYDA